MTVSRRISECGRVAPLDHHYARRTKSVDDSAALEGVFRRYSGSKGPFYLALAEATANLDELFRDTAQEIAAKNDQKEKLEVELDAQLEQHADMEGEVQIQRRQLEQVQAELGEAQELLDQANNLAQLGFGEKELTRLFQLLVQVAANQGAPPEEEVAQLFRTVERYERVVSLDLEATRAEARAEKARAEVERWQAEADARKVQSKARISVIDLVDDLLDKGVKGDDFVGWAAIIDKADVTVEELAQSLEEYSNIAALSADRQRRAEELQTERTELEAQVCSSSARRG